LARLHVRDSIAYHPLGPVTFAGALWLVVAGPASRRPAALSSAPVVGALAGVWLLVWLRRLAALRRR